MDLLRTAANPWGQDVLVGIGWDLVWLAVIGAAAFVVLHTVVVRVRGGARLDTAPHPDEVPPDQRVERHSAAARAFHWIMSLSMFGLLITAFVPVLGWEFAWVELHWISGMLLLVAVVYHVIHAIGWQDFWSMWMGPSDVKDSVTELKAAMLPGSDPGHRTGKYPADHKLYHHMAATASIVAIATGLLMMVRIDTPFWTRNPYLLSDGMWGVMYVLHGLSGVALIGLVVAHVYFAVRPEKRWLTWSMVRGWITREKYHAHFDPTRWKVEGGERVESGTGGALASAAPQAPRDEG